MHETHDVDPVAANGLLRSPARRRLAWAVATAILCVADGRPMEAADLVPPQAREAGFVRMIFDEEFDRPLDLGTYGVPGHRWYRLPNFNRPLASDAVQEIDGFGRFTTPVGDRRGLSARMATISGRSEADSSFVFKFGYIEGRLRFDANKDNWAAFWLLGQSRHPFPMSNTKGVWCEIDIAESLDAERYMGTIHDWKDGRSTHNRSHVISLNSADFSQFNTFGLLWVPNRVEWYFNNEKVRSAPIPDICREEAVGIIVGAQKQRGEAAQKLDVDWIRVYQ